MASNTFERTGVVEDTTTGEKFIPASRRPDGTWRKPRRVKDGYVPQEEMPVYENKGVQWLKSKPSLPPGLDPSLVSSGDTTGMSKSAKKNAKKKEKKKQQQEQSNQSGAPIQNVTHSLASVNLNTDKSGAGKKIDHKADSESSKQVDAVTESQDVTKKLRALKKKLRQIEDIEKRLQSGELKNPEKDQLDKVERKQLVLEEIADLELKLDS